MYWTHSKSKFSLLWWNFKRLWFESPHKLIMLCVLCTSKTEVYPGLGYLPGMNFRGGIPGGFHPLIPIQVQPYPDDGKPRLERHWHFSLIPTDRSLSVCRRFFHEWRHSWDIVNISIEIRIRSCADSFTSTISRSLSQFQSFNSINSSLA